MNNSIDCKNFLILGGTSGIGFDVAKKLSLTSKVYVIGRNDQKIKKYNSKNITFFKYEFVDLDSSIKFFNSHLIDKKFDGAFVSVGAEKFKGLNSIKDRDINNTFMPPIISLLSVLKLAASSKLINKNSSIVTMSSVSAIKSSIGMALYGSSRATIESLVKHSSSELANKKIRVNAIRAGAFKTEMHDRITSKMKREQVETYEKSHLLGFGEVEDVSEMVIYLLSNKSKWFTGSIITLDGGYLNC